MCSSFISTARADCIDVTSKSNRIHQIMSKTHFTLSSKQPVSAARYGAVRHLLDTCYTREGTEGVEITDLSFCRKKFLLRGKQSFWDINLSRRLNFISFVNFTQSEFEPFVVAHFTKLNPAKDLNAVMGLLCTR